VLREFGIARHVIQRQIAGIRSEGYQMLRVPSLPIADFKEIADALKSASTETVILERDAAAVGRTIGDLRLRKQTGVTIIAITRDGHTEINPGPEHVLQPDDVLVLLGGADQIDRAIEQING
jgi:CPA2 family monovalent cation:H+ antiporter-2